MKRLRRQPHSPINGASQESIGSQGLEIFLLGLAKKAVLADTFARFADVGFNAAGHGAPLTLFEAWYALLAYGLQIYFDFSGYSVLGSTRHKRPADTAPT